MVKGLFGFRDSILVGIIVVLCVSNTLMLCSSSDIFKKLGYFTRNNFWEKRGPIMVWMSLE
jgi:hypothetical protein